MTMKKKLAVILCSLPFAAMPVAFAQTGGSTEGTTSPQSGTQTDMGEDGAPNQGGENGAGNNTNAGGASAGADTGGTGSSTSSTGATGGDGASGSTGASGATGGDSSSSGASGSSSSTSGTTGSGSSGASSTGAATSSTGASGATTATADPTAGDSFQKKLKGESVHNENDEKVGDVKDVVMSADGKVTHVILGVGGFIGVGEHTVAIPYDEIQTSGDKLILRGYTKDQLKDMPAYEYPREERAPATAGGSGTPASPMGAPR